ncbi:hypothetical protein [Longispora albida]|uniref:hypothetical protein n=1 Tax=Longispora albida TaxID=203523 RepID=UPI0003796AA6|nr:hypothetical protein [Longispora albida]
MTAEVLRVAWRAFLGMLLGLYLVIPWLFLVRAAVNRRFGVGLLPWQNSGPLAGVTGRLGVVAAWFGGMYLPLIAAGTVYLETSDAWQSLILLMLSAAGLTTLTAASISAIRRELGGNIRADLALLGLDPGPRAERVLGSRRAWLSLTVASLNLTYVIAVLGLVYVEGPAVMRSAPDTTPLYGLVSGTVVTTLMLIVVQGVLLWNASLPAALESACALLVQPGGLARREGPSLKYRLFRSALRDSPAHSEGLPRREHYMMYRLTPRHSGDPLNLFIEHWHRQARRCVRRLPAVGRPDAFGRVHTVAWKINQAGLHRGPALESMVRQAMDMLLTGDLSALSTEAANPRSELRWIVADRTMNYMGALAGLVAVIITIGQIRGLLH